ncbi:MAG: glycoside hydrolase family 9 protein, partial [Bacteroidales bacterium]|nr:glycoside hydrolase family 9 protein [Bacteroidales bacterium]
MKKQLLLIVLLLALLSETEGQSWVRVNQLGYLPVSVKVAVFISEESNDIPAFTVCDAINDREVFRGSAVSYSGDYWGMASAARLDFSALTVPGGYYISYGKTRSEPFRIAADVYDGTADYIFKYIRAQRCGYNPFLLDSCHTHDGVIVDHPTMTGQVIDVIGGYHDASDHLRYTSTTANSVYQMMFAWNKSPGIYRDEFDAAGLPGANG